MPNSQFDQRAKKFIQAQSDSGQLKPFYNITSPMRPVVTIADKGEVLVLCANNYLGLADHPEVIQAGIEGLNEYGAGTASVRFICGTLECHRRLEEKIASFVH
jgi:glycine C-acetyltransferase